MSHLGTSLKFLSWHLNIGFSLATIHEQPFHFLFIVGSAFCLLFYWLKRMMVWTIQGQDQWRGWCRSSRESSCSLWGCSVVLPDHTAWHEQVAFCHNPYAFVAACPIRRVALLTETQMTASASQNTGSVTFLADG